LILGQAGGPADSAGAIEENALNQGKKEGTHFGLENKEFYRLLSEKKFTWLGGMQEFSLKLALREGGKYGGNIFTAKKRSP